ncbi:DNA pilot protein [Peromfec virus RodF7_17]|uniref:DNA pilot protein n=1 Tax=Peromfec virus RodF7_17 TaxID=2929352 RepID=A0A976R8A9_9VIRU|nr:DNA pilot protein [Peromfec virus RodF7_17]
MDDFIFYEPQYIQAIAPLVAGALISSAGSLIGNLFGKKNQDDTNKANMQMLERQFEQNKEMWNLQNEYNTPLAQRERMEEAGFNANLIAGGASSGNAQSSPQMGFQEYQGFVPDTNAVFENAVRIQQARLAQENMAKVKADTTAALAKASKTISETASIEFDTDMKKKLEKNSIALSNFAVQNAGQALTNAQLDGINKIATFDQIRATTDYTTKQSMKISHEINYIAAQITKIASDIEVNNSRIRLNDSQTSLNYTNEQIFKNREQREQLLFPDVAQKLIAEVENLDYGTALRKIEAFNKRLKNTNLLNHGFETVGGGVTGLFDRFAYEEGRLENAINDLIKKIFH